METAWQTVNTAYEKYMDSGDPRVSSWFLVNSPIPIVILVCLYVAFVKIIGPAWMANRQPFDLRLAMIAYNIALVVCYIHVIRGIIWAVFRSGQGLICRKDDPDSPYGLKLAETGWFCLMLKLLEFADTIFFVLRKKFRQISTLHVVHHAIVPVCFWMVFRIEPDSYNYFFPMANSFIHVVMYTYYGLSALGPSFQKYLFWKKYLTILQLVQFVSVFIYCGLLTLMSCKISKLSQYMHMFLAGLFLILFCNFFRNTYSTKKSVKKE